jgi:tetratricopeptide (TPR) repeat protein
MTRNILLAYDSGFKAVSIYGKGGVGKTALGCKVMGELEKDLDNVYGLVYLSTRTSGISLEKLFLLISKLFDSDIEKSLNDTWLDVLIDTPSKIQILLEHLSTHRVIIFLDNMGDILDSDGEITQPDMRLFIEDFLRQEHSGRLLITSRRPLQLAASVRRFEKRFPLDDGLPDKDGIELLKEFDPNGEIGLKNCDETILLAAVKKTFGFPRALEAIAGILDQDPFLSLKQLLDNKKLFDSKVIENLVGEAQLRLGTDDRLVMQGIAVFGRPVTITAIRFLLEPYASAVDIDAVMRRLVRGRYIAIIESSLEITEHPLDQEYNYQQIPDDQGTFNRKTLHKRAAQYYAQLRTPEETWQTLADLEPQLLEFDHLIRGGSYDEATKLIESLDYNYLSMWGRFHRLVSMREPLIDRISLSSLAISNLHDLGWNYVCLVQYDNALKCFERSLALCRHSADERGESANLSYTGVIYEGIGDISNAIHYQQNALSIAERLQDKLCIGTALSNLGFCNITLGEYKDAIECHNRALDLDYSNDPESRGDDEAYDYWGLGVANLYLNNNEKALRNLRQAYEIAIKNNSAQMIHDTCYYLALRHLIIVGLKGLSMRLYI